MSISKFFVPKSAKKPSVDTRTLEEEIPDKEPSLEKQDPQKSNFMPFNVKGDMRLAPLVRIEIGEKRLMKLDGILKELVGLKKKELYFGQLKSGVTKPIKTEKTWPTDEEDDVTMIGENHLI